MNCLNILSDDKNQLIRVTVTNAWKDEFGYDGKMRRRIERDYTWSGSAWAETNEVHFIYDGNVVLEERNSNNVPLVTYTRVGDNLLARSDHSQPPTPYYSAHSYYHADGNGNITMLINADQVMVAKYLYDPYGNTLSMSGSLANQNNYRFSSKEWNNNAGYYYYLYRYYDPNLQRWVNRDPIQEEGGLNLYRFVDNNTPNYLDFEGLNCFSLSDIENQIAALQVQYNQVVEEAAEYEQQATLTYYEYNNIISKNPLGTYLSPFIYDIFLFAKQQRNERVIQAKNIASQIRNLRRWAAFLEGAGAAGRACVCVPAEVIGALSGLIVLPGQNPLGGNGA